MDVLQKIKELQITGKTSEGDVNESIKELTRGMPIDGDIYAMSNYLKGISSNTSNEFYIRYIDHLTYFTSLFGLKGDDDIERLSPHIMRQLREFGKVAITKLDNKLVVLGVVHVEYDMHMKVKYAECITLRAGYSYIKKQKTYKLKGDKVVIIRSNYQAFPFIYIWQNVLTRIIALADAATTGSVASVKKMKRTVYNNDSIINKMETESIMNPKNPYVNRIARPASYLDQIERNSIGDPRGGTGGDSKGRGLMANDIELNNTGGNLAGMWDNLNAYKEFEYFQKGRRMNTNKKTERNISAEIDTEIINFDILDEAFLNWLRPGVKEINKKFGQNISIKVTVEEAAPDPLPNQLPQQKEVKND